jgi:HAD superfamily hydrolase (TIGR01509 family)
MNERPTAPPSPGTPARDARPETGRIAAIVSDLGKVVLPFDVERAWEAVEAGCSRDAAPARQRLPAIMRETRFGCGGVSGEEFHRRLVAEVGLRLSLPEFQVAWSDMFWVDHEVVRLIETAPVRRRVLLSNTNELHWSWITGNYAAALRPFDRLLVSHECGLEKPDPAIYRLVIRETGLPPAAHLFIDDIEENVHGARAVGMEAVLHTDAAALRRELGARGLLPPR